MGCAQSLKAGKVIVAGHSCLDITPIFPRDRKASNLGEILTPGSLIQIEGVDMHAGGAVSNTGIAMKLMGARVELVAKTGTDPFGRVLKDIYAQYGVAEGVIQTEGERTSYTMVLAVPGIDRVFLHDPGCNDTFSPEDVRKADLTDTVLFHFGYPSIMEKMYEDDGAYLIEMMRFIKSQGIAVSLDLAAVDPASKAGKAHWGKILAGVLPYVDFFVPSVEELCFMLDQPRYQEWVHRAGGGEIVSILRLDDIVPLAEKSMELGAKVLLLKCGAPGLYYRTAGKEALAGLEETVGLNAVLWADREGFENSYLPEKVLSGTGAGDTTVAAFLASMLEGRSLEMCVRLAAAQGASCVEAYGALGGIRPLQELERRIADGWQKGPGLKP